MAARKLKYNQRAIKVIALIICALYLAGGVGATAAHQFFHQHKTQKTDCECAENAPKHFHQTAYDFNLHAKCPVCQQGNTFALINCNSDNYTVIFATETQKSIFLSKKYLAEFYVSSPRAPPISI